MCLAVPGQVLSITNDQLRTATISFGGTMKEVSLALVPEADVGDYDRACGICHQQTG